MNFQIHLPLTLTCHITSNLVGIKAIQERLSTIFSAMSSQKTVFVVISQLPFLTIYPSSWSHQTLLLIDLPINLEFFINLYKLKFKTKPQIVFGIQRSISVKKKLLKKFISKKDPQIKAEYHKRYKKYRKLIPTLLKESNWKGIRNTWKGI